MCFNTRIIYIILRRIRIICWKERVERIEKGKVQNGNVPTWNVRRILYFEPVFEFPLSCHVQILDLPTRFVKLLAKLSSPQQRSTDFLYLPCKLSHNIYTIILEPSPHPFIPFSLANFIVSYFFLSQQQCIYIYIYITTIPYSSNRKTSNAFYRSLSLSFERDSNNSPSSSHALFCQSFARLRPFFYFSSNFSHLLASWRRGIVVSKGTLMERILKNKRDVAGTEMKTAANSSFVYRRLYIAIK